MKDYSGQVPVQLWQLLISMNVHVGQKGQIKDASLAYNGHYKSMTFAINFGDEFEVIFSVFLFFFKFHVFCLFYFMLILSSN